MSPEPGYLGQVSVRKLFARTGGLTLILLFAIAASASAAVRCVGSNEGDCTSSHTTINAAVGAATSGQDTVRIAAGTYDEAIETTKVLTFEGAESGTPDDATGAAVVQPRPDTAFQPAFKLPNGGTLRALRAVGARSPSGTIEDGMPGVLFKPGSAGSPSLAIADSVILGGFGYNTGSALTADTSGQSDREVNVTADRSTLKGGGGFDFVDNVVISGKGKSAFTRTSVLPGGGRAFNLAVSGGHQLNLVESSVSGGSWGVSVGDSSLEARRSRVVAALPALTVNGSSTTLQDSLIASTQIGGSPSFVGAGVAQVWGDSRLTANGTTFAGITRDSPIREPAQALSVAGDSTAGRPLVTLRNSIARIENAATEDVELVASGGTIDADHTAFSTRSGAAPAPGSGTNLTGDPLFTDPAADDFTVKRCSPVIDRGNPGLVAPGQLDLAGSPRSLDGDGDGSAAPDLGAFERTDVSTGCPQPPAPPAPPAPGPADGGAVAGVSFDQVPPTLSRIKLTRRVFAPFPKRGRAARRGTRFRFRLSERATVKITFHRILGGRRAKIRGRRRCVSPRSARRGRRCERLQRFGWLKSAERAGNQSIVFKGRLKGSGAEARALAGHRGGV